MRVLTALLVVAGSLVLSASQQHDHQPPEKLGQVQFDTSCAPEVAAPFNRAVALLHSFSFSTARDAFAQVAKKDPTCAMAHWGIAMATWGNPFGGLRADWVLAPGREAVARARSAGTPTPRERAYIEAVAELYKDSDTVDQRTRVLAYEQAMERLHAGNPADLEGAIFYALAINQTALPTDKTYAQQLKAAAILEKLWAGQPQHPGLAHYIIHAYDHPPLADRALDAARRYATIAPSAPHALHMPSHTFTRVGYWQESIDTNIASAAAALRDKAPAEALHAMDYQTYAYLQSGQDAAARRVADEAPRILAGLDVKALGGAAPPVAGHYAAAAMQARYALERGAWAEAAALEPLPTPFPHVEALTRFARALGAARSGKPEVTRAELVTLQALQQKLADAKDTYWAGQVGIQHQVASAWLAFAENRRPEALKQLLAAADAEDATDKAAISPGPLAPARELYGEMLLAADRPADALKAFTDTLKKEPNRFRATYLAGKAALLAGDKAAAKRHFGELITICKAGDQPGRPELAEARTVASR